MSANIRAEKNKYILLKSLKKTAEVTLLTGVVFHISLQQMMSGSLVDPLFICYKPKVGLGI